MHVEGGVRVVRVLVLRVAVCVCGKGEGACVGMHSHIREGSPAKALVLMYLCCGNHVAGCSLPAATPHIL